jgi:hypothetical protein
MKKEWLLSVIREVEEHARLRSLHNLVPLVERAYAAARSELDLAPPVDLQTYRLHRQPVARVGSRRV